MGRDSHRVPGQAVIRKLPDLPTFDDVIHPVQMVDTGVEAEESRSPEPAALRIGTPERPLRVGVIGLGIGAAVHLPILAGMPETQIIGLSARRHDRMIPISAQYQIFMTSSNFREIISDSETDAVIVASPPHLHHQMVIAAIEAGKHIVCETPLGRSLAESKDMAKMAASANVVAMVNHHHRFDPVRERIKSLLDNGYVGVPQAVNVTVFRSTLNDPYARPYTWRDELERGGGMLAGIGSHTIDTLRWWLGEIESVAGAVSTMVDRRSSGGQNGMVRVDGDDNFAFMLRFASQALGTVHVTTTAGVESGEEILISGSEGMLIAQSGGTLLGARRGERELVEIDVPPLIGQRVPSGDHPAMAGTARLLARWVAAIRDGGPTPEPTFHDGAKAQEIIDGVRRSSQQARWIDVSGRRFPHVTSRF